MEYRILKEKEPIADIESGEASNGENTKNNPNPGTQWGKKSLNKLVSGIFGFNGSNENKPGGGESFISEGSLPYSNETTALLVEKKTNQNQSRGLLPIVNKDDERDRRKAGKVKKAPKPPRPPKSPSLDIADMRLVREISKIAMKKRERIERMKALKKMKAARVLSQSSASSSSLSSPSFGGTISAMVITVLFFLVIILQGLGSSSSSKMILAGAPQPAPETTGLTPLQFYETVLSDDGAAPNFIPPRAKDQVSGSEFSSPG